MKNFFSNIKSNFGVQQQQRPQTIESVRVVGQNRRRYACGKDFVTLDKIPTWTQYFNTVISPRIAASGAKAADQQQQSGSSFAARQELCDKISLYKGDSTTLEIDAIVNAAKSSLMGGGGIDGAIHDAAGDGLLRECMLLNGCSTGKCKITGGHDLPAKYVIHTVGPIGEDPVALESCYFSCLDAASKHNPQIRTIGFCCVSTGIYGYPLAAATEIALSTVRKWMEKNWELVDRIIFVVFLPKELDCYQRALQKYFPVPSPQQEVAAEAAVPESKEEDVKQEGEASAVQQETSSAAPQEAKAEENGEAAPVDSVAAVPVESSQTEEEQPKLQDA